jgi:mRNA-degrading endonuclease RelE of RelBE toxin-antitoxin system
MEIKFDVDSSEEMNLAAKFLKDLAKLRGQDEEKVEDALNRLAIRIMGPRAEVVPMGGDE